MNTQSVYKSAEGKKAVMAIYNSLLSAWPIPYEAITVPTRHGDTFVVACGEPSLPPLVLLHGSSSNSAMWIGDVANYARFFRVYAVDLPGEPGKSADIRPDLTTSAFSDWMCDVLNELHVSKASFVGISLGGWLAMKFALAHPDRIDRLTLLCPSGFGRQKAGILLYMLLMKPLGKWGERKTIKKIMGSKDIPQETVEYSRLIARSFSPYMGTVPVFEDEELKRMHNPLLLIAGDKDVLVDSKGTAERVRALLPQAEVILLPGAGHGLINQGERILPFLLGNP